MTRRITFFQGQSGNAISSNVLSTLYSKFSFYINASGVTSGANVFMQAQSPIGDWHSIYSLTVSSGSAFPVGTYSNPASQVRALITGWKDGGFSISAEAY